MPDTERENHPVPRGTPWCRLIDPPCPYADIHQCGIMKLLWGRSKEGKRRREITLKELALKDRRKYVGICGGARHATSRDFTPI